MNRVQIWVMSNEYETSRIIGGLGIVATQLSNQFVEYGNMVTLFTNHAAADLQVKDCGPLRIIHIPETEPFYSKERNKNRCEPIVEWLKANELELPDVIHIHSVCFTYVAYYFRQTYGIPIVYTCHSLVKQEGRTRKRSLVSSRQHRLLRVADLIVVPSRWQKKSLCAYYPTYIKKVEVIENGINRTAKPNNQQRTSLLFVGRLTSQKGIQELLTAVGLLSRHTPYVSLMIVGQSSSQAFQSLLLQLVRKHKLEKQVKWLGFVPPHRLQKVYASCGAVIVPSKQESFGLVALEALANGVPLVSTRSGGLSQFITSDVAQVIPRVTAPAIAQSIISMWRDTSRTEKRVQQGIVLSKKYEWRKIALRYLALFQKLPRHEQVLAVTSSTSTQGDGDDG